MIMSQFNILRQSRKLILKIIDGYSIEQLNFIPNGFKNNIAWNVAHLIVTQQLICYNLSGLPMHVTKKMVNLYKKGTAPEKEISSLEFENIKEQFISIVDQFEKDYKEGIFKDFNEYTTSVNVTLSDIDSAIAFNDYHEGIHLGIILSLRKLV
ncbi:MAG: hypothetical protein ACI8QP_000657 [Porticoccaceae bacterium]|jgi:hypothetical protein